MAFRERKPLVLLVEGDPEKGATSAVELRAEVKKLDRLDKLTALTVIPGSSMTGMIVNRRSS